MKKKQSTALFLVIFMAHCTLLHAMEDGTQHVDPSKELQDQLMTQFALRRRFEARVDLLIDLKLERVYNHLATQLQSAELNINEHAKLLATQSRRIDDALAITNRIKKHVETLQVSTLPQRITALEERLKKVDAFDDRLKNVETTLHDLQERFAQFETSLYQHLTNHQAHFSDDEGDEKEEKFNHTEHLQVTGPLVVGDSDDDTSKKEDHAHDD